MNRTATAAVSQLVAMLQQNVHTVEVQFASNGRSYTYKAHAEMALKEGDHVVVETPSTGLTLVQVVKVHDTVKINAGSDVTYKWILGKVDLAVYSGLIQRENEILAKIEELKERKKQEDALKNLVESLGLSLDELKELVNPTQKAE